MEVVTTKIGTLEMAFPWKLYLALFNNISVVSLAAGGCEVRVPDFGNYILPDVTVSEIAEHWAEPASDFWTRLVNAGLPLSYFSTIARKKAEEDIRWLEFMRNRSPKPEKKSFLARIIDKLQQLIIWA